MNSTLKIFITILVTTLIVGSGIYWWQNTEQETPVEINTDTTETIEEQDSEKQPNATKKDYTWSKYDITFNYPDGWTVYDTKINIGGKKSDGLIVTNNEITGDTGGGFAIELYAVTHLSLNQRIENLSTIDSFEDAGQIKFSGNAFRLVYLNIFDLRRPLYLIENNGVLYEVHAQNESIAEEILESLSFL